MKKELTPRDNIILMFILITIWYIFQSYLLAKAPLFRHGELIDTDSYMRLVRVEQLAQTGDWYDSISHRSNAPYGETSHWTRPLDIILLAGALLATPFWGFHAALYKWAIILNPTLGALAFFAFQWAVTPLIASKDRFLAALFFFAQLSTWQTFIIAHPDHHGLLILLFILVIGCCLRILLHPSLRHIILAGLISALGLWISIEFLFPVLLILISLSVFWLKTGKGKWLNAATSYCAVLTLASTIFLFIERGLFGILRIEYDKISIIHILIFFAAFLTFFILTKFNSTNFWQRAITLLCTSAADCLLILLTFPKFLEGPFANVNPKIIPIWLSKVNEVQPFFPSAPETWIPQLWLVLLTIGSFIYLLKKRPTNLRKIWFLFLIGMIIYVPLTIMQIRWERYLDILLISLNIPLVYFIVKTTPSTVKHPIISTSLKLTTILFLCLMPSAMLLAFQPATNNNTHEISNIKPVCEWLNTHRAKFNTNAIIATSVNYGPEILYRTKLDVIATPYHRNDSGILFCYRLLNQNDMNKCHTMIQSRNVQLILLDNFNPQTKKVTLIKRPQNTKLTFEQQLLVGNYPDWITEIQLPEYLSKDFRLFEIQTE